MRDSTRKLDVRRAKRILLVQTAVTLIVGLAGLFFGTRTGLFALLGGVIATVGNALFAFWVFGHYRASAPGELLGRFYIGELIKLAFIAAAFVAAIVLLESLQPVALFGAFLVVQVLPPLLANRIAG